MRTYAALAILLIVTIVFGEGDGPKAQPIPDSATAIKVAKAALVPVYGKKRIESEEPFSHTKDYPDHSRSPHLT